MNDIVEVDMLARYISMKKIWSALAKRMPQGRYYTVKHSAAFVVKVYMRATSRPARK